MHLTSLYLVSHAGLSYRLPTYMVTHLENKQRALSPDTFVRTDGQIYNKLTEYVYVHGV